MTFGTTPQNGPASWQNRFVNTRLSTLQVSAPGLEYSVPVCDDGDDMCIDVKHNSWRVNENSIDCVDCPEPVLFSDNRCAEAYQDCLLKRP